MKEGNIPISKWMKSNEDIVSESHKNLHSISNPCSRIGDKAVAMMAAH